MTSLRAARSEEESCIQCEKFFPSSGTCKRHRIVVAEVFGRTVRNRKKTFKFPNETTCDYFKNKEADE